MRYYFRQASQEIITDTNASSDDPNYKTSTHSTGLYLRQFLMLGLGLPSDKANMAVPISIVKKSQQSRL